MTTIKSTSAFLLKTMCKKSPQIQSDLNGGSRRKGKVVFIMGATGAGKTKLSIDLATHFNAEIINSDKIQVYKGLDISTNKASEAERKSIPHHLFDFLDDPDADFTPQDFIDHVHVAIVHITQKEKLPIIVGGSNSYIEALLDDEIFKSKYETCFLWVDVALPVHYKHVEKRVDQMVDAGVVDEIKGMFRPGIDHTKGIWRTIGVPEMERYCLAEMDNMVDEETKELLLDDAIKEMKVNTCKLVDIQLGKIKRFKYELGWEIHRMDATFVLEKKGKQALDAWKNEVLDPCLKIVEEFLTDYDYFGEEADANFEVEASTNANNIQFVGPMEVQIRQEMPVGYKISANRVEYHVITKLWCVFKSWFLIYPYNLVCYLKYRKRK